MCGACAASLVPAVRAVFAHPAARRPACSGDSALDTQLETTNPPLTLFTRPHVLASAQLDQLPQEFVIEADSTVLDPNPALTLLTRPRARRAAGPAAAGVCDRGGRHRAGPGRARVRADAAARARQVRPLQEPHLQRGPRALHQAHAAQGRAPGRRRPASPRCPACGGGAPVRVPPRACLCGALCSGRSMFGSGTGCARARSKAGQRGPVQVMAGLQQPAAGSRAAPHGLLTWPQAARVPRPPVCFSHPAAAAPRLHRAPACRSWESPWSRPALQRISPPACALATAPAPAEGAAPALRRPGAAAGCGRYAARGGALPALAPRARAAGGRAHWR